jgi:dihydroxyacetone kinase phosphotransfer subunit
MGVGLVIVSHSRQLAAGVKEVADQMAGGMIQIRATGGAIDGSLGTNAEAIMQEIIAADGGGGVLVLMDLGSAVLSAETAIELAGSQLRSQVILSDAPLVEGAVAAAVEASIGRTLEEVAAAALSARDLTKVTN